MKTSILYICLHDPFGTVGGGHMASHAYLRAFADIAESRLDLICAECIKSKHTLFDSNIRLRNVIYAPDRSRMAKYLSVFTGYLNRYIPFVRQYLKDNYDKYSTIVFDHNSIAGPLVKIAKSYGLKTITIHHNYEKEYYHDNHGKVDRILFLRHVVNCEKNAFLFSDLNLFLTEQDKQMFHNVYGKPSGQTSVIGVFEFGDSKVAEIKEATDDGNILQLVITGSLCTVQGVDGIKYFFQDLYPHIPKNVQIVIAGRKPTNEVVSLCNSHENVCLVPNPENMEDIIRNGDVYICPTRVGGGLKLRVMDGLKLGIPVITHQCSARGYDMFVESPFFKVFSDATSFAESLQAILALYSSNGISKKVVQEKYLSTFAYHSGLCRIVKLFEGLSW